jgi:hypothetical protein
MGEAEVMACVPLPRAGKHEANAIQSIEEIQQWGTEVDEFQRQVLISLSKLCQVVERVPQLSTPNPGGPLHADTHRPDNSDPLAVASPAALAVGNGGAIGTANDFVRSDHEHAVLVGAPNPLAVGDSQQTGSTGAFNHSNHQHAVPEGSVVGIGVSNSVGDDGGFVHGNHTHTIDDPNAAPFTDFVTTIPNSTTRNDITPTTGDIALRALSSHISIGGTGSPAGSHTIDSQNTGGLIVESGLSGIFANRSLAITSGSNPRLLDSINVTHGGAGAFAVTDNTRCGFASFMYPNDPGSGTGDDMGVWEFGFYPQNSGNNTGLQETDAGYLTRFREMMKFHTNQNSSSSNSWDGRGSMVLGLTGDLERLQAGEDSDPWQFAVGGIGGIYKSRLALYCLGAGTETLNHSAARGSDVGNMNGLMIVKEANRMPGNALRYQDSAARTDEITFWGGAGGNVYSVHPGLPLYIRMVNGDTGVGGVSGNRPGRYMSRWHVDGGITSATTKAETQFGDNNACFDLVSEFKPQLGVVQPRFVLETGERIMLRPDRQRVNIGGNPESSPTGDPPYNSAKYMWQGGHDASRGAVEIDGRLRLWAGPGASYPSSADASHDGTPATAKGVDFVYDGTTDLVYLYAPEQSSEVARFSSGSIDWSGGGTITPDIIQLDQSPDLNWLDYISFDGATANIRMGAITEGTSNVLRMAAAEGSGVETYCYFYEEGWFGVKHVSNPSTNVGFYIGNGSPLTGLPLLRLMPDSMVHDPTVDAIFTINVGDSLLVVDDTTSNTARPVMEVLWDHGAVALPGDRELFVVGYVDDLGGRNNLRITNDGVADTLVFDAQTTIPTDGLISGTFWAGNTQASNPPFVFNTNVATLAGIGVIQVYSAGNWRATIGEPSQGAIFNEGVRAVNTASDPFLEMEGASAVARQLSYDDGSDLFYFDTDLRITKASGDPTLYFDGATNDGAIVWDDSLGNFDINDNIRFDGKLQWGTSSAVNGAWRSLQSSGDATLQHFLMVANNTSTGGHSTVGIQCQAEIVTSAATGGATTGGFFVARQGINNIAGSKTLRGGHFKCDDDGGSRTGCAISSVVAGQFDLNLGSGSDNNNTWTNVYGMWVTPTLGSASTANTWTNFYYCKMDGITLSGTGTATNVYGLYMEDMTGEARTTLDAIHIEAQNGTGSGAAFGNIVMAGGNWNTGHMMYGPGHVWMDQSANVLRFKATAPASESDGTDLTAGAGGGETNTASNQGTDGVGVYDTKVGVDLQFRHVAPGSTKMTTTLNGKDIDVDADTSVLWNFTGAAGAGDYSVPDIDLAVGDVATPDYGLIRCGDSIFGRTSRVTGALDLDGTVVLVNRTNPLASNILFAMMDNTNSIRFALPKSAVGNATYNPRSMLIAGPAPVNDACVTVGYWQGTGIFDNLVCDTSGSGADLGVQNDLEVEGNIYVDTIAESTTAAGVTIDGLLIKDGGITETGLTHDHDGVTGGGTIDHVDLANKGSNSHVAIDLHIAAITAHGATGGVMGATNTQTVSNKDMTATTNSHRHTKGITIESPTSSEDITWFFTDRAITVVQVRAVLNNGASTPSVTYQVYHATDRSAAGTGVTTSGAVTSTTTGTDATLSDTTIPADSWVWIETSAQSGTTPEIALFIEYTDD